MEDTTLQKMPADRKIYRYQKIDIQNLFSKIESALAGTRILYQLPTGGGKTVIFSEIAKNYIEKYARQVVVLTHRTELCRQTNNVLKKSGIRSLAYTSEVKKHPKVRPDCYVAMIETLKNRLKDKKFNPEPVGLVIIDEAHHNSFRKLLGNFKNAVIVGVTATPLSSDSTMPLNEHYNELIVGEDIRSLIDQGFIAKPKTFTYPVELNSLITASHGDYTVASSDLLFRSEPVLDLLLKAYQQNCRGKKTLIFNNGILASKKVLQMLLTAGYPARHLDNKTPKDERIATLKWFRHTKGAILTSVSLLTTGFDEPSVQAVILYRATNSLTLYHQMIGRGSRTTSTKKTFSIVDLGNNTERFGEWDAPLDWRYVFENPDDYITKSTKGDGHESHAISAELRSLFPKTLELSFDVQSAYLNALEQGKKTRIVMRDSIRQHALMCIANAETTSQALQLSEKLQPEIAWRVKQYSKCLENTTKNYTEWLQQDYQTKLRGIIQKLMYSIAKADTPAIGVKS